MAARLYGIFAIAFVVFATFNLAFGGGRIAYDAARNEKIITELASYGAFTYFDVPQKMRGALGRYVPALSEEVRRKTDTENRHTAIEHAVTRIIKNKKTMAFNNIGLS